MKKDRNYFLFLPSYLHHPQTATIPSKIVLSPVIISKLQPIGLEMLPPIPIASKMATACRKGDEGIPIIGIVAQCQVTRTIPKTIPKRHPKKIPRVRLDSLILERNAFQCLEGQVDSMMSKDTRAFLNHFQGLGSFRGFICKVSSFQHSNYLGMKLFSHQGGSHNGDWPLDEGQNCNDPCRSKKRQQSSILFPHPSQRSLLKHPSIPPLHPIQSITKHPHKYSPIPFPKYHKNIIQCLHQVFKRTLPPTQNPRTAVPSTLPSNIPSKWTNCHPNSSSRETSHHPGPNPSPAVLVGSRWISPTPSSASCNEGQARRGCACTVTDRERSGIDEGLLEGKMIRLFQCLQMDEEEGQGGKGREFGQWDVGGRSSRKDLQECMIGDQYY